MDNSNINKMLNQLSKKLNIDKSKLENAAKSGTDRRRFKKRRQQSDKADTGSFVRS